MVSCEKIESDLYLFISGDLSKRKTRWIKRHLAECISCKKKVQEVQQSGQFVRQYFQPVIDTHDKHAVWLGIQSYLIRQIRTNQAQPGQFNKILKNVERRSARIAFSVCVLLFIVFHLITGNQSMHESKVSTEFKNMKMVSAIPVVEDVANSDIQVLTMETDDPTIQVVWFFNKQFEL